MRVLAFTASSHRPLLLRHCIFQMQGQTVPVSHGIYLNSPQFDSHLDANNYCELVSGMPISKGYSCAVSYGSTGHQHFNHMTALQQFDILDFDLFCKIDDDDIYSKSYIEDVVRDYEENSWDFSATYSKGCIQGPLYKKQDYVCLSKIDIDGEEKGVMPGTFVFNQKAIRLIIDKGASHDWKDPFEDPQWLRWLQASDDIVIKARETSNYIYNIHGKNVSTRHVLEE